MGRSTSVSLLGTFAASTRGTLNRAATASFPGDTLLQDHFTVSRIMTIIAGVVSFVHRLCIAAQYLLLEQSHRQYCNDRPFIALVYYYPTTTVLIIERTHYNAKSM